MIVFFLAIYELLVERGREKIPEQLLPVLNSALGEIAGPGPGRKSCTAKTRQLGPTGIAALAFAISTAPALSSGLGFIGLLLPLVEEYFGSQLHSLSHSIFGEGEVLVEAFEWFHIKFFQVALVFFCYNGWLLVRMVKEFEILMKQMMIADQNNDGQVTLEGEPLYHPPSLEPPCVERAPPAVTRRPPHVP